MSELKVYVQPIKKSMMGNTIVGMSYYIKSEADKVIAELKNEIEEQKRLRDMALDSVPNVLKVMKIIQHHKCKRCLAMAKICENKLGTVVKPGWWDKWRKRWLKLAEKFKESKNAED